MKRIAFAIWLAILAFTVMAQVDSVYNINYQNVPQENIYIQTDRPIYSPGDTVWFRLHVVDATTKIPSSSPTYPAGRSRFVYVELHNNTVDTSLVERIMIKQDTLGVFANSIVIPQKADCCYTIVAYTRWMMNFSEDLFGYKEIKVQGKGTKMSDNSISIFIMPEGGNIIAGHLQRLSYKIINGVGECVDVNVRLIRTSDDKVICEGKSVYKGLGSIFYTPEASEHYKLEASTADGLVCVANIPDALKTGVTMTVSQRHNMLYITPIIEGMDKYKLSLCIYGSGNYIIINEITCIPLTIDTSTMYSGVVTVSIFDRKDKNVYAKRNVFIESVQNK